MTTRTVATTDRKRRSRQRFIEALAMIATSVSAFPLPNDSRPADDGTDDHSGLERVPASEHCEACRPQG
ncbi:MAG: hypothetical protein KDC39_05700 [Actinobacteria bacterium]|nr:hypothetical protein [Actinomycetota bacterium]